MTNGEWIRSCWRLRELGLSESEVGYWVRLGDALGVLPHEVVCRVVVGMARQRILLAEAAKIGRLRLLIGRLKDDEEERINMLPLPVIE